MNTQINIDIKANVSEATQNIADAGQRISDSLQGVADSGRSLTSSLNDSVPALSASEQEQLANASLALQLKDAEVALTAANDNLNSTIRTYGAESKEAASALRDLNAAQANVSTLQTQIGEPTEKNEASMKSFAVGVSGATTACFSFYGAVDRVNESEISLDRANLMVKSSAKSVEDAERSLSTAILDHGINSQEAKTASDALSIAQDRLSLADERQQQAQDNVNKSMMSAALQIIPTSITMVDSLSRAWKNFPDMTGVLTTLGTNVTMVGNKALVASVSVASFVGGFVVGYEAITQFGNALGPVGRAVMAIVPAIVAAAAAVWMLMEGATLGTATIALVASGIAVGAMVANLQSYGNALGLKDGGVTQAPTFALIGEAGPEIVMPLSQYEAKRSGSTIVNGSNVPQQVFVDVGGMHFYGDIADSKFLEKSAEYTADKISDAVNLRRGT